MTDKDDLLALLRDAGVEIPKDKASAIDSLRWFVFEADDRLAEIAEWRATGRMTDEDAARACADIRLLQDTFARVTVGTDAEVSAQMLAAEDVVAGALGRILDMVIEGRLP